MEILRWFYVFIRCHVFLQFYFLKHRCYVFSSVNLGDVYHIVNYVEDRFKESYHKVAIILYPQKNKDLLKFFKTQNYAFENFYLFDKTLMTFHFLNRKRGILQEFPPFHKPKWKERKIKISENLEKQIFINPTSNYLKIKTSKDFWLRLSEKLEKETDYKVVFRSNSPNLKKFKDYSDMKIHDLFLKVFGKNTIVLGIRSGFMDLLKTCDLKKVLLLQIHFGECPNYNFSKNKNHQMYMKADFEYFISENFGNQDIEKIVKSIQKT